VGRGRARRRSRRWDHLGPGSISSALDGGKRPYIVNMCQGERGKRSCVCHDLA
jgi:hypothetical protein